LAKLHVKKVSSRFEYFLQIFAAEFVLILKVVVLDAEINSASNCDIFKGVIGQKEDLGESEGMMVRMRVRVRVDVGIYGW
jgi:hypothetical protein